MAHADRQTVVQLREPTMKVFRHPDVCVIVEDYYLTCQLGMPSIPVLRSEKCTVVSPHWLDPHSHHPHQPHVL